MPTICGRCVSSVCLCFRKNRGNEMAFRFSSLEISANRHETTYSESLSDLFASYFVFLPILKFKDFLADISDMTNSTPTNSSRWWFQGFV